MRQERHYLVDTAAVDEETAAMMVLAEQLESEEDLAWDLVNGDETSLKWLKETLDKRRGI